MLKRILYSIALICLAGLIGSLLSPDVRRFFTLYADGQSNLIAPLSFENLSPREAGAYYFVGGDFGALSTDTLKSSATPWVLTASAITLDYVDGDVDRVTSKMTREAFQQWGFTSPLQILNWPDTLPSPDLEGPLGLNIGTVKRSVPPIEITAANISCASCHSSVGYASDGNPDLTQAWLGMPNGSINFEAYPQAIFDGFKAYGEDPRLMEAAEILFPRLTKTEKFTLEKIIKPAAIKRIKELDSSLGRAVPFSGGYPGATNGLDGLNIRLGLQSPAQVPAHSAFNSIPNLEGHAYRTSFLNTGSYEIPNSVVNRTVTTAELTDAHVEALGSIVAFFTVPSMGVDIDTAKANMVQAKKAMAFAAGVETQPFPGVIDPELSGQGRDVFKTQCAACHGSYDEADQLAAYPNYVGEIGTDTFRMDLLNAAETVDAVNESDMGKYIHAADAIGYSAPVLNGVWASAPYLHNGSVPTLDHFFNPDTRPDKFFVGGHRLSFSLIGIDGQMTDDGTWAYPEGYAPWANSVLFDTSKKGLSNKGHEIPFDKLTKSEKRALLEYLKTL